MKNSIWNKLILLPAAVIALAAVSCVREPAADKGDEEAPEGYGLISLSIRMDGQSLLTRAQQVPPEANPTPKENHVEKVRLVLYNNDEVKYAFDFNIRTKADLSGFEEYDVDPDDLPHLYYSNDESHFITYARQVKRANYKMLLIINPTTSSDIYSGKDLIQLTKEGEMIFNIMRSDYSDGFPVNYRPSPYMGGDSRPTHEQIRDRDGGIAADNYFLMTNHRGFINVPVDRLQNTANSSNQNPILVEVSRAVAKVVVEKKIPTISGNASAYGFKWDLDVSNQQTYWMRMPTNMLTDNGTVGQMEPEFDPLDWYSPGREYLYGKDPNFTDLSDIGAPDPYDWGLTGEDRLRELAYQRWYNFNLLAYPIPPTGYFDDIVPELQPALTLELGDSQYCLENTMALSDQYDGVITSLVVSCTYWPAGYEAEGAYYVYNNYYILPSDMQAFAQGSMQVPGEIAGITADIAALLNDTGIDLKQPQSKSFSSNNIKLYYAGLNYYRVKILNSSQSGYGQYGILRNNIYQLTLSKISGPGSPTIIDPESKNMAANIEILQWWDRTQETEL